MPDQSQGPALDQDKVTTVEPRQQIESFLRDNQGAIDRLLTWMPEEEFGNFGTSARDSAVQIFEEAAESVMVNVAQLINSEVFRSYKELPAAVPEGTENRHVDEIYSLLSSLNKARAIEEQLLQDNSRSPEPKLFSRVEQATERISTARTHMLALIILFTDGSFLEALRDDKKVDRELYRAMEDIYRIRKRTKQLYPQPVDLGVSYPEERQNLSEALQAAEISALYRLVMLARQPAADNLLEKDIFQYLGAQPEELWAQIFVKELRRDVSFMWKLLTDSGSLNLWSLKVYSLWITDDVDEKLAHRDQTILPKRIK